MRDQRPVSATNLIELLEPYQHVARLAAVLGSEDSGQLELIDDPRRAAVADAHATLQQGGGAELVLDAHLRRLPEQRVALAGIFASALTAALGGFGGFDRRDLL